MGHRRSRQRRGEFVADAQTFGVALESTVTIVVCQEMDAVNRQLNVMKWDDLHS